MIDIWTHPKKHKAVMWLGDNEPEIEEFFKSLVEANSCYRIVDGKLEYMNDFDFPPNDVGEGADGDRFVYTCPIGNWLVCEWDELVEESYIVDYSPKEMVSKFLTREPK
jgi:hypothetical protein